MKLLKPILLVSAIASMCFLSGCSSHPIIPKGENVKVSRDEAAKDCKDLGRVVGRTITAKANLEAALEDMKKDAALKGANFVKMETASGLESAVAGQAYFCP